MAGVPTVSCTPAAYLSRSRESFAASLGCSSVRISSIAVEPFARRFPTRPLQLPFSNRFLPGTVGFKTFQWKGRTDRRRSPIDVETDPIAKPIQSGWDKLVRAGMEAGCTCGCGSTGHKIQPMWMARQMDGVVERVGHGGHRTPALDAWIGSVERNGVCSSFLQPTVFPIPCRLVPSNHASKNHVSLSRGNTGMHSRRRTRKDQRQGRMKDNNRGVEGAHHGKTVHRDRRTTLPRCVCDRRISCRGITEARASC